MPGPTYEDPSHRTIHHISQTLAASGIGCILWGEHLLRTYACNILFAATDYKFIVEDHDLIAAYRALRWSPDSIYNPCPGTYPCPVRYLEDKVQFDHDAHRKGPGGGRLPLPPHKHSSHIHPFPELHLHIHTSSNSNNPYPTVLALYRKSDFFPTALTSSDVPDIKPGHLGRVTSLGRLIYAHEVGPRPTPSRGGRFPDSLGSVLIPSPMYLVEILIGLRIRDCRIPGARSIWTRWLMYLREAYVEHGRGLDVWDEKVLLPEVLNPVWRQASDSEISRLQEPIMGVWRDLAWALVGVDVDRAKRTGHLAFQDWMVRQWDREETAVSMRMRTMTMSSRESVGSLVSLKSVGSTW